MIYEGLALEYHINKAPKSLNHFFHWSIKKNITWFLPEHTVVAGFDKEDFLDLRYHVYVIEKKLFLE